MGWHERDYSSDTWAEVGTRRGGLRWPPRGAGFLIIVHVAAFVRVQVLFSEGAAHLVTAMTLSHESAHALGILLHPFATRAALTLIFSAVIIWLLGGHVERLRGRGRMLLLYVLGNVMAGLAFYPLARFAPAAAGIPLDSPAGASAAWCMLACTAMAGERLPLLGRYWRAWHLLGIGLAVIVGLMFAFHRLGAIGWLVALTSGACAHPVLAGLAAWRSSAARRRPVVRPPVPRRPLAAEEVDIDDILAKISRQGIDALTQAERERLEAARQARLRQSRD